MPFSLDISAPARLATEDFLLRPITVADAALDYAAVMESRVVLIESTDLELRFEIVEPDKPGRYLAYG